MIDEEIIKLTGMIGAVGALGMSTAMLLHSVKMPEAVIYKNYLTRHTLSIPLWIIWCLVGLFFSFISAPSESVFESEYASTESISDGLNFGSAWTISYIVLTFAFCDALLEPVKAKKKIKILGSAVSLAYVVIWLQLLKGDRAALPWILSLIILYYHWNPIRESAALPSIAKTKIVAVVIALLFVSAIVGMARHSLVGSDLVSTINIIIELLLSEQVDVSSIFHGTWSAVLLTPLSVAGDNINNILPLKLGTDYIDLILSLPPGPVADALGYIRPHGATSGPAWEMRYGLGGTHASVVPFMNFRLFGVYVAALLVGYSYLLIERRMYFRPTISNLALVVTVGLITPHFLWYGEKYGINALIIWIMLSFAYKILTSSISRPIVPFIYGYK